MRPNLTQDSLIEALRQLRATHPGLPAVSWNISQFVTVLRGEVYTGASDNDRDVLAAYQEALGGQIDERHQYETGRGTRQSVTLTTAFTDIPVHITGSYPVTAALAVA